MEFFFIGLLLAFIPAGIAHGKGHSFINWWVFGLLFWPGAFIAALLIAPAAPTVPTLEPVRLDRRPCPACAELVRREALVCRYCGRDLPPDDSPLGRMSPEERATLTDHQKFIIEAAGYLLPVDDAAEAFKLLNQGGKTDEVAQIFVARGTDVD